MENITSLLQEWYKINKRDLPWRDTKDPYKIWLSEIILQQTQVVQGLSYYHKFIKSYPNVNALAGSHIDHILKNWQGLGYYSRARNLHYAAQQIVNDYGGVFPTTYDQIIKLKGVGAYTAAAVSSFSFGETKAVVDGNVYRVLSRLFAISTPINSTKGIKAFSKLAESILDQNNPAEHNQAMMELGALVCKPKNPICISCPINLYCEAFKSNTMTDFPVKEKKVKVKKRFLNYLLINDGKNMLIKKREGRGIWQGLYDFPMIETNETIGSISELDGYDIPDAKFDIEMKHILTHQHLYVKFWTVKHHDISVFNRYEAIQINALEDYPLPQLFIRYIQESKFFKR